MFFPFKSVSWYGPLELLTDFPIDSRCCTSFLTIGLSMDIIFPSSPLVKPILNDCLSLTGDTRK